MFNLSTFLLGASTSPLPDWVTSLLPVLQYIFIGFVALGSIAVILLVLFQQSNSGGGLNAVSGVTETYFAQNKGRTKEGRLKRATTILAIIIAVVTLLYFLSLQIVNPFSS